MNNSSVKENYSFQKIIVFTGIFLFLIKAIAWYLTKSVSILTDVLESTINILAGFFSLYSLYISSKPKDQDHPYGHGKVEFISSGIEGGLIIMAGCLIIYEAVKHISIPHSIAQLDYGIILVGITGIINYALGYLAVKKGEKNNSLVLISGGEHLKSDTYSTLGLVLGLIIIYYTGYYLLDSVIALIFGGIIIYTGIRIIRKSLAGIMDEADEGLIEKLVNILEEKREVCWIDVHNTRFIKFGSSLHLDCHLTLPWYFNLKQAHKELDKFQEIIMANFGDSFEMFVHTDACEDFSCKICKMIDCPVRQHIFEKEIKWTVKNIGLNNKHSLNVKYE